VVDYTKGEAEEVSLVRGELPSKRERGRKDDKSGIKDTDEPLARYISETQGRLHERGDF